MITWTEDFATGFPRIDAEHRKLVDLLNELEAAVQRGQGSGLIGPIVEDLRSYSDFHFRHEETCMEQHRCPTAALNKQAHAHFLAMVAKAQTRLAAGGTALAAQQVQRELTDWVVNHVLRIDLALRGCRRAVSAA